MTKQVLGACATGAIMLGSLVPGARIANAQAVTPVPQLDYNRYVGVWYEVARYPNRPEKLCVRNAEVLYALADKNARLQIVDTCRVQDGSSSVRNLNAYRANKKGTDGKLKITTLWPFSKPYWVLAIDPDYQWAVVGSPNHKMLWILSRTPVMQPDVLTQTEARAAAQGFDTAKLVTVSQHR